VVSVTVIRPKVITDYVLIMYIARVGVYVHTVSLKYPNMNCVWFYVFRFEVNQLIEASIS
jgi:hypothetical protein